MKYRCVCGSDGVAVSVERGGGECVGVSGCVCKCGMCAWCVMCMACVCKCGILCAWCMCVCVCD